MITPGKWTLFIHYGEILRLLRNASSCCHVVAGAYHVDIKVTHGHYLTYLGQDVLCHIEGKVNEVNNSKAN